MADEIFEITHCPLCGKSHKYQVMVKHSSYLFSPDLPELKSRSTRVIIIRRLLTCPKTNEMFEATLELTEESHNKIETITVENIVPEEKDGSEE